MVSRICKLLSVDSVSVTQVRNVFKSRGLAPPKARTLQERIAEMEYKDPELYYKVDIGFAVPKQLRSDLLKAWRKQIRARRLDPQVEQLARKKELTVDLDVSKDDWFITNGPKDIYTIAKHYGIYDDLYEDGYFHPVLPLTIDYDFGDEELLARVHRGNIIKSCEAKNAPSVSYKAEPDTLWTLLLTTPDGNFSGSDYEYCHWFIGNIPGNDISKGEQIIDYLRPIPPQGIGFCRYIFVLYKQDKRIDFSEYKKKQPCVQLVERNWKTYDFMKKHQDYVTPAGLAFFQADYDPSLKDFYHSTLNMEVPIYEYDFPKPYVKPQVWYPIRQAFNLYMDRYRDIKQINKEYLLKKLKKEHPFVFPPPPLKYPNAHPIKNHKTLPTWVKTRIVKDRIGQGRINEYK
ncbi:hypothetical protein QAD02_006377 [Eretmocerus hayati]|uniref:Uncharacterized protein n=1 Tax=Eretmocerus hayati TaxID=131215 RepID=A0ACC2N0P3_9HYME|nr:hypothetical protein QAD02_006377 [Eretmocerus hayati]